MKKQNTLLSIREHLSSPLVLFRVPHLFSLLCCSIMCLYVLSSVLWCRQLGSVQKITVLGTRSRIAYELWNVNPMRLWCLNIATDVGEVDYWNVEVIAFVLEICFNLPSSRIKIEFALVFIYISSIQMSLKLLRILLILKNLRLTLTFILKPKIGE
jgi:hypothetical protein